MTTTPNLALAYIASSQAQKEVTHNAALNDLDFMAQATAIDHTLATLPASPNTGDHGGICLGRQHECLGQCQRSRGTGAAFDRSQSRHQ